MEGTLRTYNKEALTKIKENIKRIVENTGATFNCKAVVDFEDLYPAVINHPTETSHVVRLAETYLGKHLVMEEGLPLTASEDFSFFLEKKPGCFYMLGIMKPTETVVKTLHTSTYDFNDDMIAYGGYFYVRIIEDRLKVKIFS